MNTHSLVGEDGARRREILVSALEREAPDVIALQEVNQSRGAPAVAWRSTHLVGEGGIPIRGDLYVRGIVKELAIRGLWYDWRWLPVKVGYGRYDEGLALLCRAPIAEAGWGQISRVADYGDWRRRATLWVRPAGSEAWFFNLHTRWWGDGQEPFLAQWERLLPHLVGKETVFLMGDLNNPAELRGEGYDRIRADGFLDCFDLAEDRRGDATVVEEIDGWHGRMTGARGFRIDLILCNRAVRVERHEVLFDGEKYGTVSDHLGVMVTVGEGENQ